MRQLSYSMLLLHISYISMFVSCTIKQASKLEFSSTVRCLTLYGNIKTAEQQTIIEQYGDWYTGWWVACYIWYSKEGLGGLRPLPISSLLYQMYQPTQQRPVYQRHIIWCDTIIYWILSSIFFMKLFKTSNIRIVQLCQEVFHFDLSSVQLARRRKVFLDKFCV